MSDEIKNLKNASEAGPIPTQATTPIWLFALLFVLLFGAAWSFDQQGGWFDAKVYRPFSSVEDLARFQPAPADEPVLYQRGKKIFNDACAVCHQASGLGSVAVGAPPLVNSEWVLVAKPDRIIRIVLHGLSGPIQVLGQNYGTGVMTPFKDALSDEDIAAVITYIRNNRDWKHKASEVTAEDVKAIRNATKDHSGNMTSPELEKIPVN